MKERKYYTQWQDPTAREALGRTNTDEARPRQIQEKKGSFQRKIDEFIHRLKVQRAMGAINHAEYRQRSDQARQLRKGASSNLTT
ncbi:MAG: hypothetical protein A3I52_01300 [Candidatus Blackburnbacteria bacterium RIFCSPLOWO2_02_FULL_40_10]|nr:MAG: hypothetical protein A3I52_01300 [Candidatus Blackburnbacteria bacterium RIFCSPLOWO2_02_FULL_40_10]HBL52420.1 hypothetical protein [Candidatus Blackburnbacteria bacterium]